MIEDQNWTLNSSLPNEIQRNSGQWFFWRSAAYPEIMWTCRDAKLKTNIIAGWEQDYQPAVTLVEHQFPSGTEPWEIMGELPQKRLTGKQTVHQPACPVANSKEANSSKGKIQNCKAIVSFPNRRSHHCTSPQPMQVCCEATVIPPSWNN